MKQPLFDNPTAAKSIVLDQPDARDYLNYVHDRRTIGVKSEHDDDAIFLAVDDKMLAIREIIDQIAPANVPVLITGESGTGKEVVARAIHEASNRAAKPFVAVNCAALPSSLLESELFGFERGSFTDAHQRHIGKFERATGGTLLLDEVTEIEAPLQAKLLRVLQEKEIERIGGQGPIDVDVRIIATTNRDIVSSVAQGTFRQDLYYRLYVIHLEIPALRERPRDIPVLAEHFAGIFGRRFGKPEMQFSPEAIKKMLAHSWPGNVRELQNVVQHSILMASGSVITSEDVPIESRKAATASDWVKYLPVGRPLHEVETQFILETLKSHQGNRTHAAKTLGISLRTLRNKINEFTAGGLEVVKPAAGRVA